MTHIWFRAESKPGEERSALDSKNAKRLIDAGFRVTVEDSQQRCYATSLFEQVGCEIAAEHSWENQAPHDALILGLKELAESDAAIKHRHIHFAHVYKRQTRWEQVLGRFERGNGTLYDLEYLTDEQGRRVAAFGYWAGFAGAALAALAWARQQEGADPPLQDVRSRANQQALVEEVQQALAGRCPSAMVIGALGRSGRGACEFFRLVGIEPLAWDMEETKAGGPFGEVLDNDVFVNCVFIQSNISPFITPNMLERSGRRLSVICDVSCDPYGDYNPLPIYSQCTTFANPSLRIVEGQTPVDLIAIDHLPSLLPQESSTAFCDQLTPHLLKLDRIDEGVWRRAYELFQLKLEEAREVRCG